MNPTVQSATLRALPEAFLSRKFKILGDGEWIAELGMKSMREEAELRLGEDTFRLGRENWMSGAFFLAKGDEVILKAEKPSAFISEFLIMLGQDPVRLKKKHIFSSTFELLQGDQVIGRVTREGFLSRKVTIDLPAGWPLPLRIFVFWLAQIIWNRQEKNG